MLFSTLLFWLFYPIHPIFLLFPLRSYFSLSPISDSLFLSLGKRLALESSPFSLLFPVNPFYFSLCSD